MLWKNNAIKENPPTPLVLHPQAKKKTAFGEIVKSALIAIIIVLLFRTFIAQPFVVSGSSMDPTFAEHEYLIVDQISYKLNNPARGDVIVFRYPLQPSVYYIKRIIGLPGETVRVVDGNVQITKNNETFELIEKYVVNKDARSFDPITLGADEYYVMGDNRPVSADSRLWGSVPKNLIIGKPAITMFPVARATVYPGATSFER